jgi:predicted Zn-dependent peptidase
MHCEGSGRWQEVNEAGKKYQAVTPEDIQRVVKTYFTRENRAVATYTRKPAAPQGSKS